MIIKELLVYWLCVSLEHFPSFFFPFVGDLSSVRLCARREKTFEYVNVSASAKTCKRVSPHFLHRVSSSVCLCPLHVCEAWVYGCDCVCASVQLSISEMTFTMMCSKEHAE